MQCFVQRDQFWNQVEGGGSWLPESIRCAYRGGEKEEKRNCNQMNELRCTGHVIGQQDRAGSIVACFCLNQDTRTAVRGR